MLGVAYALSACGPKSPQTLARADDRQYGTAVFTWLVDHEPSAIVVWRFPVAVVSELLPGSRIVPASATNVCVQAARRHALLLLVETRSAAKDRAFAEDCGFALERDRGAIVIAPR